ncbi:MAG: HAD hydrolase-like protein [Clostridiales bacterium]
MKEKGLIFDLENILIFYEVPCHAEEKLIWDFLISKKYIFHSDDLQGKNPCKFADEFKEYRGNDDAFLQAERAKLHRKYLMDAVGTPSVSGVLQTLAQKYQIVILAQSQGDGIIKALAKAGIRNYVNFIVPGEKWVGKSPITLGLDIAMEKYPKIPKSNWLYVGNPSSHHMAKAANIRFFPYGIAPYENLEDIMEELI